MNRREVCAGAGRLRFRIRDDLKRTWSRETRLDRQETGLEGTTPQLVGGTTEFAEAKELMALLNREIKRGFDAGSPEEATAQEVHLGKFTSFLGQDRIRLITHMAYLAYRGELQ